MNILKTLLLTAFAAALISGCSEGAKTDPAAANVPATEIVWEDLMPEGEDEVLEKLYMDFYEDFDRRMMQNSTSLSDAADVPSMIVEGSADDTMEQIGTYNVVTDLNGERVRVPGYVVPFDFNADAEHTEFLLVPYFGACLHTPPPPPNQIIFVTSSAAVKIENIEEPVWLEGTLTTGQFQSDLGNSAYELELSKLEPYEY